MMNILRRYSTWRNTVILLVAQFVVQFSILLLIYPQIGGQGYPLDKRSVTPDDHSGRCNKRDLTLWGPPAM